MRIALFQARTGIDPAANAERLVEAVREAAAGGAAMLFTPEMSGLLDRDRRAGAGQGAARGRGRGAGRGARAQRPSRGIWVHLGSLALQGRRRQARQPRLRDRRPGEIRARYDKIHLFDVDLPTGESWRESGHLRRRAAKRWSCRDTPVGRLGLTICYDLRFPALFAAAERGRRRRHRGAGGLHRADRAGALAGAAAGAGDRGRLFIVAAAQAGQHEDGRETYGHSLVVDPWGEVLLDMGGEPGLAFAEIDLGRIAEVRARIPVHSTAAPIAAGGELIRERRTLRGCRLAP